jgi:hemolysin activation/secretion protein
VLSFDPLVDTERFRIGGEGSVRAFPAAEFAGDQGIAGTIEFRRPLGWIPSVPLQFSTFYDAAIVHQKKTNPGEHKTESLTGVGVGLSTLLAKRYTIEVQVAQPTTAHDGFDGRETRLWFAFGANF